MEAPCGVGKRIRESREFYFTSIGTGVGLCLNATLVSGSRFVDKSKKLKRYLRKDYSQSVSFPVEIVGRDGLVRRYSFEDSVRLYQRRIASSELRYHDPEVARAESGHCRSRIQQLRRSYFEHFGWADLRAASAGGDFAGEVVAFLLRYLGDAPQALSLESVQTGENPVWMLQGLSAIEGCLLYLYRFDGPGPCAEREGFFQQLRWGQSVDGPEVERVIAFHHTADCGLILTGRGEGIPQYGQQIEPLLWDRDSPGIGELDAFQKGVRALSVGNAEEGMVHFEHAIAQNPYRHRVHACVVAVSDYLGRPEEMEIATRVGLHYFPQSPSFHYMAALSHFKMGDLDSAEHALGENAEVSASFPSRHRALRVRIALARGDWRRAGQALNESGEENRPAVDSLLHQPELRRLIQAQKTLKFAMIAFLVCALVWSWVSLPVAVWSATAALGSGWLVRKTVPTIVEQHLSETRRYLGLGLPENLMLERPGPRGS